MRLRITSVAALLLLVSLSATARDAVPAYKAAFVFNFVKLVTWPETRFQSRATPLKVCVASISMEQPLRQALAGNKVGTHPIELTAVTRQDDLSGCHVLYLGREVESHYRELLDKVRDKGVFTVDEGRYFTWPDGMMRLFLEHDQLLFELNVDALERSGLRADPRLVRLARMARR